MKNAPVGLFFFALGQTAGPVHRRPTASYTLDYEKNAQGIFTASLDLLQPGRPARHPQGLDESPARKRPGTSRFCPWGPLYGIGAIKPAIAAASLLPVLHAGRYTLAADEACRVTVFSRSPLPENTLTLNGRRRDAAFAA